MNPAVVPCDLPSTGAAGVSIIVLGIIAIAVGIVFTRLASRRNRLPLAVTLIVVAAMCATAPQRASADSVPCSTSPSPGFSWPGLPDFPSEPVCDNLMRVTEGGFELAPNIGVNVDTGSGNGSYWGFSMDPDDFSLIDLEDPAAWLNGFIPDEFSYEWQILVDGVWETAPWDTGTSPLQVTGNTPLLDTISGALFAKTGRLFVNASDGRIEQGCDVYLNFFG